MPRACKRCGVCCLRFYLDSSRRAILRSFRQVKDKTWKRDYRFMLDNFVWIKRDGNRWLVVCRALEPDYKKGRHFCSKYKDRPHPCRNYPEGRSGKEANYFSWDCGYKGRKKK